MTVSSSFKDIMYSLLSPQIWLVWPPNMEIMKAVTGLIDLRILRQKNKQKNPINLLTFNYTHRDIENGPQGYRERVEWTTLDDFGRAYL